MESSKNIRKLAFKISWPMIVSELTESLYSLTDTYFVSKLGTHSLAGIGVASYVTWLIFGLTSIFSVGALVFIAQAYGAKELKRARVALGTTIPVTILLTLPVALAVSARSDAFIALIAGSEEHGVITEGASYLSIRALGFPIMAVAMCLDASLRAVGATKYSMISIVFSALLNVILDPIMIFGLLGFPKLGVAGAALATVISSACLIPLSLTFLKRLDILPIIRLDTEILLKMLRVGVPATAERFIFSLGNGVYIAIIARCGPSAMAAHQIGVRIESVIFMPGFAFSIAASTLVGQYIGAGNLPEGKKAGYEVAKLALIYMSLLGVLVALASRYIAMPFSTSEEVLTLASIYLVLAGLSEPGLALAMTIGGAVRGAGNTVVPLIINSSCLYLVRIVPSLALVRYMNVFGAWLAMAIDVYVRGAIMLWIYQTHYSALVRRLV